MTSQARIKGRAGVLAAVALLFAGPLTAQVAWDSPLLASPGSPIGWGLLLVDPSAGEGIGLMTTWRGEGPVGYRLGVAEDRLNDSAVFGGVDYTGGLLMASDDLPVDIGWVAGAGLGVGEAIIVSFPLGLSVGRELQGEGVWLNPYLGPRVLIDASFPQGDGKTELDLGIAVDLGLDVSIDPGWAIRVAGTAGDRSALAIGFTFRIL